MSWIYGAAAYKLLSNKNKKPSNGHWGLVVLAAIVVGGLFNLVNPDKPSIKNEARDAGRSLTVPKSGRAQAGPPRRHYVAPPIVGAKPSGYSNNNVSPGVPETPAPQSLPANPSENHSSRPPSSATRTFNDGYPGFRTETGWHSSIVYLATWVKVDDISSPGAPTVNCLFLEGTPFRLILRAESPGRAAFLRRPPSPVTMELLDRRACPALPSRSNPIILPYLPPIKDRDGKIIEFEGSRDALPASENIAPRDDFRGSTRFSRPEFAANNGTVVSTEHAINQGGAFR